MTENRLNDTQYLALDYDDWKRHVYTTGDQRYNTICMGCNLVEAVSNPLLVDTIWWVCTDCKEEEE